VDSNHSLLRAGFTIRLHVSKTALPTEEKLCSCVHFETPRNGNEKSARPVEGLTLAKANYVVEEREGFEPSGPFSPAVFETAALSRTLPPLRYHGEARHDLPLVLG
jgi:hypothetical protein